VATLFQGPILTVTADTNFPKRKYPVDHRCAFQLYSNNKEIRKPNKAAEGLEFSFMKEMA